MKHVFSSHLNKGLSDKGQTERYASSQSKCKKCKYTVKEIKEE